VNRLTEEQTKKPKKKEKPLTLTGLLMEELCEPGLEGAYPVLLRAL
jgi:hypothetical protein